MIPLQPSDLFLSWSEIILFLTSWASPPAVISWGFGRGNVSGVFEYIIAQLTQESSS